MKELLLLMGAFIPEEEIVREIKNRAEKYLAGDKNEAKGLTAACMMLLSKSMTGDSLDKAMAGIKRLEEIEARDKLHKPIKS